MVQKYTKYTITQFNIKIKTLSFLAQPVYDLTCKADFTVRMLSLNYSFLKTKIPEPWCKMNIAEMWKRFAKNEKNLDFHVHLKNRFLF
jgi:hypothetical protein